VTLGHCHPTPSRFEICYNNQNPIKKTTTKEPGKFPAFLCLKKAN
jgi:hypothetical protein